MFSHPEFDQHRQLRYIHDRATGLRALIAIHSTALGPAFGGCRMWPYEREADAVTDALRLARGMTHKAAICDLPFGGGKSVIIGDPRRDKTPALLAAMARAVEDLGGRYIIADDIGTTLDDLQAMRAVTAHTAAATLAAQTPLTVTAYGVFHALRAAVEHVLDRPSLAGVRVAIQGLGNVGGPLCGYLRDVGAELVVADLDAARVAAAEAQGTRAVAADAIYDQEVDVFAPCALGAILNETTIPRLRARIVCGGANNQLATAGCATALAARGILYVPDFIANAGGVIDFDQERRGADGPDQVLQAVARLYEITRTVLDQATREGRPPLTVAEQIVAARLHRAHETRRAA